ncbi:MAG TPA: T9SS type A sorting domain-containing protein, partial [Chryseosolibacter sp.]|nr:T9SS type A sorting domain-containing protein [Chryseosolibacter sp.]
IHTMRELKTLGTNLIFRVRTASNGEELWRSNGTPSGTYRYKTIRTGQALAPLYSPSVTIRNSHYFIANDGIHGNEVWRTQGTGSSTYMLADLNTSDAALNGLEYDISSMAAFRDSLYISAIDNDGKWSLFKCKGNAIATVIKVANINAVKMMAPAGNRLYLFTYGADQRTGLQLWKTNGTAAGTTLVKELPASENIQFHIADGILYFNLNDGARLWRSDGTECGTYPFETGIPSFDLTGIASTLIFNGFIFKIGMEPYIYNTTQVPDAPCATDLTVVRSSADEQNSMGYPNPFTDEFVLRVAGEDSEVVSVFVTTMTGSPVESIDNVRANRDRTIGKTWVPGMYILRIQNKAKHSSTIVLKK